MLKLLNGKEIDVVGTRLPLWEAAEPDLHPLANLALAAFGGEIIFRKQVVLQPNLTLLQATAFPKKAQHYLRAGRAGKSSLKAIQEDFIKNLQTPHPVVAFEDIRQMSQELAELGGTTPGGLINAKRLIGDLQSGLHPIDAYLFSLAEAATLRNRYNG